MVSSEPKESEQCGHARLRPQTTCRSVVLTFTLMAVGDRQTLVAVAAILQLHPLLQDGVVCSSGIRVESQWRKSVYTRAGQIVGRGGRRSRSDCRCAIRAARAVARAFILHRRDRSVNQRHGMIVQHIVRGELVVQLRIATIGVHMRSSRLLVLLQLALSIAVHMRRGQHGCIRTRQRHCWRVVMMMEQLRFVRAAEWWMRCGGQRGHGEGGQARAAHCSD